MLLGCASVATPTSGPTAAVEPPGPPAVGLKDEASDPTISVHVTAFDGSPLRAAEITITRVGFEKPLIRTSLDPTGSTELSLPRGAYRLSIAAVDHAQVGRELIVSDDVHVEGQLGTYARELGPTIPMVGEWLDADGEVLGRGPTEAQRSDESLYRIDVSNRPENASELRYQLRATGSSRTHNGPLADRYESDGGGDYWSIVRVADAALELDFRELAPPSQPPELDWVGDPPGAAVVRDARRRWIAESDRVYRDQPRRDAHVIDLTDAGAARLAELATAAATEVESESDPTTRALLRAARVALFFGTLREARPHQLHDEVAKVLEDLPPDDLRLALVSGFDRVLYAVGIDDPSAQLAADMDTWLQRRVEHNPAPGVALDGLQILMALVEDAGDSARVDELYPVVLDPRFEGAYARSTLEKTYDPDRVLKVGEQFPSFDFRGLGEDAPRVRSDSRRGRVYLLEFWASWCGPCVAAMPELHDTYAEINGAKRGRGNEDAALRRLRGVDDPRVEFVFVSLDHAPAEVDRFRSEHWSMPWTHAFVELDTESAVKEQFGVSGVPTAVLVGEDGTILALGAALRGDALRDTLAEALGDG